MTDSNKPDEWFKVAERLGNQLANNIEKFGDKVQKVVEQLVEKGRDSASTGSITVEDARHEGGFTASQPAPGQTFEYEGQVFLRLKDLPSATTEIWVVQLDGGRVKKLEDDALVSPVRVKITLQPDKPEREL